MKPIDQTKINPLVGWYITAAGAMAKVPPGLVVLMVRARHARPKDAATKARRARRKAADAARRRNRA